MKINNISRLFLAVPLPPLASWANYGPSGIFVLSRCISLPLTPGLILMLNYFSFANDVARLQSARLNMYGGCEVENRFYGDAVPSLSLPLP